MANDKYEFTGETKEWLGATLRGMSDRPNPASDEFDRCIDMVALGANSLERKSTQLLLIIAKMLVHLIRLR